MPYYLSVRNFILLRKLLNEVRRKEGEEGMAEMEKNVDEERRGIKKK